jgi:hypothetical protein
MGNSTTNDDFPDAAQRYAVCNTQWNDAKKKEKKETLDAANEAIKTADEVVKRHTK